MGLDPERRVDVSWDARPDVRRPASLKVLTDDRAGVLAAISKVISSAGVSIQQAVCRTIGPQQAINEFDVTVGDLKQLKEVMKSIEKLEGVQSVERV
jgi:guanosine-3',5'-bis(diphosphate) 3'-pyrophosphohydrolase